MVEQRLVELVTASALAASVVARCLSSPVLTPRSPVLTPLKSVGARVGVSSHALPTCHTRCTRLTAALAIAFAARTTARTLPLCCPEF